MHGKDRNVRLGEVLSRVGVGKTKLYAMIACDGFPRPTKIGRASVWLESQGDNYLDNFWDRQTIHDEDFEIV